MEKSSLTALARTQLTLAEQAHSGRSAHTVFGGHEHTLRQTLIALTAGTSLAEHANPGEATVHVLHGTEEVSAWLRHQLDGAPAARVDCPVCGRSCAARADGTPRKHPCQETPA